MEPLPQPPEASPDRQLPEGRNKVQRISTQTQGLVQEMKRWIDLRIALTKLEIRQEVEARQAEIKLLAGIAVLGALGGFFGLVALALGLGAWLGHPAWGFLAVTVVLVGLAGILLAVKPSVVREARKVTVQRDEPDEGTAP